MNEETIIMKFINLIFDNIWIIQIKLMKFQLIFNSWVNKNKKRYYKFCTFVVLVFFLLTLVFSQINKQLLQISFMLFVISLSLFSLLLIIKILIYTFTSIRCYFLVSIILNMILSNFIAKGLISNSSNVNFFSILIFTLIFCTISLFSNSNVGITSNTIIEILLGMVALTKTFISYLFEKQIFSKLPATIDEVVQVKSAFLQIENSLLIQIDYILFPLLIINGLALLICTVHSYWIKKYNDGQEITWDKKLIKIYVEENS